MIRTSPHSCRPRVAGLLAGALLAAGVAAPARPALAQGASLVGSWTGLWDGASDGFVEYRIVKATPKGLAVDYGWHPRPDAPISYERITCRAVAAGQYNCGASELTVTSPSSIQAVMHAQNGRTPVATLSR